MATFLATLGGKAQVVTFALDALRARGVPVSRVVLFHLAPADPTHRLRRALRRVEEALAADSTLALRAVPIQDGAASSGELADGAATTALWQALHREIGALAAEDAPLHLCLTGGPRLLALLALSAAALHFRASDRLWHLYTDPALRAAAGEGAILHAPPGSPPPHLIEVPILPGAELFPALRGLLAASPEQVAAVRRATPSAEERAACAAVVAALTPRQRQVLALAAEGIHPAGIAARLVVSEATVSSHLHRIYKECRIAWALPDGAPLDYRWLRERFGGWEGVGMGTKEMLQEVTNRT